jgi:hypothetical protein
MSRRPEQGDAPCEHCEILTSRWIAATEQLSRFVSELTGKRGTVPKHVYASLYEAAEGARRSADAAEKALTAHGRNHHGNQAEVRATAE